MDELLGGASAARRRVARAQRALGVLVTCRKYIRRRRAAMAASTSGATSTPGIAARIRDVILLQLAWCVCYYIYREGERA